MTIRKFKQKDLESIRSIFNANTPQFFDPSEEKELIHYLSSEIEDYFVIENDAQIIGCGGINYDDDSKTGIISWDIIHPDFQGQGVGQKLLAHRLNILKSNKISKKIIVRTSQLTFKFYEKSGFTLIDTRKDFWAKGFDLYHMEIKL